MKQTLLKSMGLLVFYEAQQPVSTPLGGKLMGTDRH